MLIVYSLTVDDSVLYPGKETGFREAIGEVVSLIDSIRENAGW